MERPNGKQERELVRWGKVLRARAAIARGDYVTPEKLEATADRLVEELSADQLEERER